MIPSAKILIVEDDEIQRFLYSEELREEGYDSIWAKNGKETMKVLNTSKPDIIVIDIVMPVIDDMEALGRIVGHYRNIPIVLYSSYLHYKADFMSWAANASVNKSSDLTDMKRAIGYLLKRSFRRN